MTIVILFVFFKGPSFFQIGTRDILGGEQRGKQHHPYHPPNIAYFV